MLNTTSPGDLIGTKVIDSEGDKIGTIGQVYVDTGTGMATWVSVQTGLFGRSESFVPIDQAESAGESIRVSYTKDFVKDAPRIDADDALEQSQEDELYVYYGLGYAVTASAQSSKMLGEGEHGENNDIPATYTDDSMARSEGRLHVGAENSEAARARLRKHVVTENETVAMPVTHREQGGDRA